MIENKQETTAELNILDGTVFETRDEQYAWDLGRFQEFRRTEGIWTAQWGNPHVNDRPFHLGFKRWTDPIDGDLISPITIKTLGMFRDVKASNETGSLVLVHEWIEIQAKNNTIGEIIKGFDSLLNSYYWCKESGRATVDAKIISQILIEGDVVTIDTSS